jgi:putative DNA primase/helicase
MAITNAGGASLMIVDPIVSAVAGDGHKSGDVRRGLQPLVDLAMDARCALFGITHFSKGTSGRDPLERVTGSISFGALARVVFVAAKEQKGGDDDSESPPRRMFLRCKSNIGADDGGFEYSLEQRALEGYEGMFASVATFGPAVEGDTRAILNEAEAEPGGGDGGALSEAKDWLFDFLLDGPRGAKEVQSAARDAGHNWRTVRRAKQALGVQARKSGMRGGWEWFYPGATSEVGQGGQENPKASTLCVRDTFGNTGHLRPPDDVSGFEF